jgi:hypothetical protein
MGFFSFYAELVIGKGGISRKALCGCVNNGCGSWWSWRGGMGTQLGVEVMDVGVGNSKVIGRMEPSGGSITDSVEYQD